MAKAVETTEEQDVIVKVNGLEIRRNSVYKISNKPDKTAPDGFQKVGTTKLPSEGIENSVACRYVIQNANTKTGVFDTGFFVGSPCYAGLDDNVKSEKVKALKKYIVSPYETIHGDLCLDNKNLEFWDSFSISLYDGRVLNTANPDDLLDLFIAVNSFELTPAGQEGSPQFNMADYIVEDKHTAMDVDKKRTNARFKAIGTFSMLGIENETKLINILKHLSVIRPNIKPNLVDLQSYFEIWLNKDYQNADAFNKLYEKAKEDEGYNDIVLQVKVMTMILNGKLTKLGGQYQYKGVDLGVDSKSITQKLKTDTELVEIYEEIMLT
jgi:hypothetical protein